MQFAIQKEQLHGAELQGKIEEPLNIKVTVYFVQILGLQPSKCDTSRPRTGKGRHKYM